jgi:hypothetical protein
VSFHLVDAVFYLPIPMGDKLALAALATDADHDGTGARPGRPRLRRKTSGSETFVKDRLRSLAGLDLAHPETGGSGRGDAVEYRINAELVYGLAIANGWKDTRKGSAPAPFANRKGSAPAEKGSAPTVKGSADDPHSVLGIRYAGGADTEVATGAESNGHRDEPTLAELHPRQDGEDLGDYLHRLSRLHAEANE